MILSDRTILITGATSGVGRALAETLAAVGAHLIIHGRDADRLGAVATAVEGVSVMADLTAPYGASRLVTDALAAAKRAGWAAPSILINNAAVQLNYLFGDRDTAECSDDVAAEIAVDLTAPIQITTLLLPSLREVARGSRHPSIVVNVTSGLALAPKKSAAVYCAAKGGLHTFSKALRYQMEDEGTENGPDVRIIEAMLPLVDTPMTAGRDTRLAKISPQQAAEEIMRGIIAGRDEIDVGKARIFRRLHRWFPTVAERMLRDG